MVSLVLLVQPVVRSTVSGLHLPDEDEVAATVAQHWDVLSAIADVSVLGSVIAGMPAPTPPWPT